MIIGVIISYLLCICCICLANKVAQNAGPAFLFALFFFGACIFALAGLLTLFIGKDLKTETNKYSSIEYPASEYKLEYKITTIGEKSDTTYVLTRYN